LLLDSNIIIHISANKNFGNFFENKIIFTSIISKLEVLGYHRISEWEKSSLTLLFDTISILEIDDTIIEKAISLRQIRKISLGDSIIAGTAIVRNLPLVTANTDDFKWIEGLDIINPLIT
jgi:predicted nucleic acid-binding protein